MADLNGPPPWKAWTADQWRAMADRAQAYLDRDPTWKVGPDVVRYYRRMAERAPEGTARCETPSPTPTRTTPPDATAEQLSLTDPSEACRTA